MWSAWPSGHPSWARLNLVRNCASPRNTHFPTISHPLLHRNVACVPALTPETAPRWNPTRPRRISKPRNYVTHDICGVVEARHLQQQNYQRVLSAGGFHQARFLRQVDVTAVRKVCLEVEPRQARPRQRRRSEVWVDGFPLEALLHRLNGGPHAIDATEFSRHMGNHTIELHAHHGTKEG